MKKALKSLINALDRIFESHEEVGDTAVRLAMYEAVHKSFIVPEAGYVLPAEFAMFDSKGDKKVCNALTKFLKHPEVVKARSDLTTPEQRLAAFQDDTVESSEGNSYDEWFGYAEKP